MTKFDKYAVNYNTVLAKGLAVSGEDQMYFSRGRIVWLSKCLQRLQEQPRHVLDFGCGTGTAIEFLLKIIRPDAIVGLDISAESLAIARQTHPSAQVHFLLFGDYIPKAEMDLVFCNGVFHHIPLAERGAAIDRLFRSLRPGGLFALWENNPWNPGTHIVMHRIPFDRDAIKVWPVQARRLLRTAGFEVLHTSFQFVFPSVLRRLRGLEKGLSRYPLGAQYQVLCRKPIKLIQV